MLGNWCYHIYMVKEWGPDIKYNPEKLKELAQEKKIRELKKALDDADTDTDTDVVF